MVYSTEINFKIGTPSKNFCFDLMKDCWKHVLIREWGAKEVGGTHANMTVKRTRLP